VTLDSFGARAELAVGSRTYDLFRLDAVVDDPYSLPYSLRVLLENLLRHEDGENVGADDIRALADRSRAATEAGTRELQFMPARVLMQDFTGVPAIVDLAAMRDAMADLGGDPRRPRHRPFDRRRRRRCPRCVRAERPARVRAQS
jgi:aconitate hydratase